MNALSAGAFRIPILHTHTNTHTHTHTDTHTVSSTRAGTWLTLFAIVPSVVSDMLGAQ